MRQDKEKEVFFRYGMRKKCVKKCVAESFRVSKFKKNQNLNKKERMN